VKITKKKLSAISWCLGGFLIVAAGHAADLKQSTFTQVVNDVRIVSAADSSEKPAMVKAVFNMPDLVRTGTASRAELVAEDNTITRVGANTVFSFDPANRTIDLQQGSLLFHSPKGKGGGTIHTGSATASVLGTTIIVTTTRNGGFKVIDLEGHVAIKFLNGLEQHLAPGQMTFVLHDGHPAPVITIRLDDLTSDSKLVQGFAEPLPSLPLILEQVADQVKLIESGQAQDTGLLVGDYATRTTVQVIDDSTIKSHDTETTNSDTTTTTGGGTTNGGTTGGGTTGGGTTNGGTTGGGTTTTPTDVTINGSTLPSQYVFSTPTTVGGITFPAGFLAPSNLPNLTFSASMIDLTAYNGVTGFIVEAPNGTLAINNSLTFNGLSSTAVLDLYANQFSFASGSTIEADVGTFKLEPQAATTLSNVTILNAFQNSTVNKAYGEVYLLSPSTLSLSGCTVKGSFVILDGVTGVTIAGGSTVTATFGNLSILDGGGISISGSTIKAIQGTTFSDTSSGSVTITGTGAAVNIKDGSSISAALGVTIKSDTAVNITGTPSTLTANNGNLWLDIPNATGTVTVTGASTLTALAGHNVVFNSGNGLSVDSATLNGSSVYMYFDAGALALTGATINADTSAGTFYANDSMTSGSISIKNTTIKTFNLTLGAPDSILLDNTSSGTITAGGGTASLTATTGASVVSVTKADLSGFTTVNMTAHTINLTNVAFTNNLSNIVTLKSSNGTANFGSSLSGYVNFISGNTWGGAPITSSSLPSDYNIHISTSGY
jgi:hypothetical protein